MASKTIVFLLAITLALTITGTVVSFWKLNQLGTSSFLTGAAISSGTGQANLTITATTSLTNQNANINFGSGRINQSCNFCGLYSRGTYVSFYANGSNMTPPTGQSAPCCVSFSIVLSGFLIENTGNVNLSVGYTCSGNCTYATFVGGNRFPSTSGLELTVASNNVASQSGEEGGTDSAASCVGGGTLYRSTGWNITNSSAYGGAPSGAGTGESVFVPLSSFGHWLCGNQTAYPLMADNARDAAQVHFNITVPDNAIGTGVGSSFTLTFNGTSSG